jgi:hypothetical protein
VPLSNLPRNFSRYRKTKQTRTVHQTNNKQTTKKLKITKYTYTDNSVRIDWINTAGKESITVFAEFAGHNTKMAQQQNGDNARRAFHRC